MPVGRSVMNRQLRQAKVPEPSKMAVSHWIVSIPPSSPIEREAPRRGYNVCSY